MRSSTSFLQSCQLSILPLCMKVQFCHVNGWQLLRLMAVPVVARTWAKNSLVCMCAARERRLASFHAGNTSLNKPGAVRLVYIRPAKGASEATEHCDVNGDDDRDLCVRCCYPGQVPFKNPLGCRQPILCLWHLSFVGLSAQHYQLNLSESGCP